MDGQRLELESIKSCYESCVWTGEAKVDSSGTWAESQPDILMSLWTT